MTGEFQNASSPVILSAAKNLGFMNEAGIGGKILHVVQDDRVKEVKDASSPVILSAAKSLGVMNEAGIGGEILHGRSG